MEEWLPHLLPYIEITVAVTLCKGYSNDFRQSKSKDRLSMTDEDKAEKRWFTCSNWWFKPHLLLVCVGECVRVCWCAYIEILWEIIHCMAVGWYQTISHQPSWQIYPGLLFDRLIIIIFLVSTLLKLPQKEDERILTALFKHHPRLFFSLTQWSSPLLTGK